MVTPTWERQRGGWENQQWPKICSTSSVSFSACNNIWISEALLQRSHFDSFLWCPYQLCEALVIKQIITNIGAMHVFFTKPSCAQTNSRVDVSLHNANYRILLNIWAKSITTAATIDYCCLRGCRTHASNCALTWWNSPRRQFCKNRCLHYIYLCT